MTVVSLDAARRTVLGPVPRDGVRQIAPYEPGLSGDTRFGRVFKLSSNESALGPSTKAVKAFKDSADKLNLYPDGSARELREAIAKKHGIEADRILCGAGSDEILSLIASAFVGDQDEVIISSHGFIVYKIVTLANGGKPVEVPEVDLTADLDGMYSAITDKTKVVYIANPNNPTGSFIPFKEIIKFQSTLPKNILLVIDGAYAEYLGEGAYDAVTELVRKENNVIMTRTFSKIYGLASLRLGWCYGPSSIISDLNRIRGPFNVSTPAIKAGIAALDDDEHVSRSFTHNNRWRPRISSEIQKMGFAVSESAGNFVLIHFNDQGEFTASNAESYLAKRGLILRKVGAYGLPNCLRLTVGSEEANHAVIHALSDFSRQNH
jgi:histidinol-phosphate aminotransferase